MDILMSFAIVALAAGVHATFHLSVSVLTLLSSRILSKNRSHFHLTKLSFALVFGTISATIFLFCTFAFLGQSLFNNYQISRFFWAILIGLCIGTAISVWVFYYRKPVKNSKKSDLWIPKNYADFLNTRTKKTNHSAESFSLGVASLLSEIIFILAPISVAAMTTIKLQPAFQFVAVVVYTTIVNLPVFTVACLISGGHSIAKIQIWREKNKKFLQFLASLGLLVLAWSAFVNIFGVIL